MPARDRPKRVRHPARARRLLGTTDTDYPLADDEPYITLDDVTYLLDAANRMFAVEPLRRRTW